MKLKFSLLLSITFMLTGCLSIFMPVSTEDSEKIRQFEEQKWSSEKSK